jgi:hypothetical protein
MKTLCLTLLFLFCSTVAFATPIYTATHLGSDAGYTSFLQFGNDDIRISFFTNKFYTHRPVTHDLEGLEGEFSVWVVDRQQRFTLDGPGFQRDGDNYYFEDWNDYDYNDFRFTLTQENAHSSAAVPEPGTLIFLTTGMLGLWLVKRRF